MHADAVRIQGTSGAGSSQMMSICHNRVHAPAAAVDKELPYELRALEAALFAATKVLESETSVLESRALPSLASLAQKVSNAMMAASAMTHVHEAVVHVN